MEIQNTMEGKIEFLVKSIQQKKTQELEKKKSNYMRQGIKREKELYSNSFKTDSSYQSKSIDQSQSLEDEESQDKEIETQDLATNMPITFKSSSAKNIGQVQKKDLKFAAPNN